eukprot:Skav232976  [mRNA]  locus=scaffold1735:439408:443451:- [translate_table: standard]
MAPVVPVVETDPCQKFGAIFAQYEELMHAHLQLSGKPGLLPTQRGRARTMRRTFKSMNLGPLKPSRPGEPIPEFSGHNLQYKRWFTQLRRVRAYQQGRASTNDSERALEHRVNLWSAILRAVGFGASFQHWWAKQHCEQLHFIPQEPPSYHVAKVIHDFLESQVQLLASRLKTRRQSRNAEAYKGNPNLVYRDIKTQRSPPVQVLVAKATATVIDVVDDQTIQVEPPLAVAEHALWESCQGFHHVENVSEDLVSCKVPHGLQVGDVISTCSMQGTTREIHASFCAEWRKRWDFHRDLPPHHWDSLLQWIDHVLPSQSMPYQPIEVHTWVSTIRAKKKFSAVGMDGISRADLLNLPGSLQLQVLEVIHHAEDTGVWAPQLMHGSIHSLAKLEGAEEVGQFRPVTILPLVYRCWSTVRSCEILRFLSTVVPTSMYGNLPGRASMNVWWELQAQLEMCMYQQVPCSGIVTDLIKAFNCLPRAPLFHAARKVGISEPIVRAWESATYNIQRHFWVRGEPSEGLCSVTGMPEGCGLSVVGMVLYDLLLHEFLRICHPPVMMQSYVDNLELQAESPDLLLPALTSLAEFTKWMGVPIDPKKTFAWALGCQSRKDMKAADLEVMYSSKDLGAQMQYSGQQRNSSVREKCINLSSLWSSLCKSRAPRTQKEKVLCTVAWPRSCHGAATAHLSTQTFLDMRRGAMKALGLDKAGANPSLQFALQANTLMDPEFYCLWDSVSKLRLYGNPHSVALCLSEAAWTPPRQKKPGPFGVLLSRLEKLHWAYFDATMFKDQDGGHIDLIHAPMQELRYRLKRAFHHVHALDHRDRKGFAGLHQVDVRLSTLLPPDSTTEDVALLQVLHNGTFVTNDQLHHAAAAPDEKCPLCGQQDSLVHRHWRCQHTQPCRSHLTLDQRQMLDLAPECTRERGWILEPAPIRVFKQSLQHVPSQMFAQHIWPTESSFLELFTDGACLHPNDPTIRLAAWGVVQAVGPLEDYVFQPIAEGGVPGQWQTVLRAEILAVICAARRSVEAAIPVRIWCDNAVVVRRVKAMQQQRFVPKPSKPDHDLWIQLYEAVQSLPVHSCICKVGSHQRRGDDPVENWTFDGNDAADALATAALDRLPSLVRHAHSRAVTAYLRMKSFALAINKVFVLVGRKFVQLPRQRVPEDSFGGQGPISPDQLAPVRQVMTHLDQVPLRLQFRGFHKVGDWLRVAVDETAALQWVTWYELMWSFQAATGIRALENVGCQRTWQVVSLHQDYHTMKACKSFAYFMTALFRVFQPDFAAEHVKPANYRWQHWGCCVAFPWRTGDRTATLEWLNSQLGNRQIARLSSDVGWLPPATDGVPGPSQTGLHAYFR